jgi:hypothetical protein
MTVQEQDISFSREIDLNGTLARMVNKWYIHSEENVVQYWERLTASSGDHRFAKQLYTNCTIKS